jgi:hypothetical protein
VEERLDPNLGIYYLKLKGITRTGRVDYEIGVVGIGVGARMITGGALADQMKICYTQAKSRLSQSLGGGILKKEEITPAAQAQLKRTVAGMLGLEHFPSVAAQLDVRPMMTPTGDQPIGGTVSRIPVPSSPSRSPQAEATRTEDHEAQGNEYERERERAWQVSSSNPPQVAPVQPQTPTVSAPTTAAPARATVQGVPQVTPSVPKPPQVMRKPKP